MSLHIGKEAIYKVYNRRIFLERIYWIRGNSPEYK
jgi:hypothetical protein